MCIRRWAASFVMLTVVSCAASQPPVAVIATRPDALALAGTWEGEYSSAETQRFGRIQFFLSADPDSASGEVLMFPRRVHRTGDGAIHAAYAQEPQRLSIQLVMAEGDSVMGVLSPYEDYDGSTLLTRFAGIVKDGTMSGRYMTQNLGTQQITGGEWNLWRKHP